LYEPSGWKKGEHWVRIWK